MRRVDQSGACWAWMGPFTRDGYARTSIGPNRKKARIHRFLYEAMVRPLAADEHLDHLCRNRGCVNPQHLEVVDNRTNVLRGTGFAAVNALKTHCPRGHAYETAATIRRRVNGRSFKVCRTCDAERCRLRRREKKP
jgi:hypothetical protein